VIAEISKERSLLILLAAVLRGFGVNLPLAANGLTPAFSLLGLLVGAAMIRKTELRSGGQPYRWLSLLLVLRGALTNRSFLAWTGGHLW
jgi:hypothetical protein